jgi:hypothetical protein
VTKVSVSDEVIGFSAEAGDGIHDITYSPNGDIIVELLAAPWKVHQDWTNPCKRP